MKERGKSQHVYIKWRKRAARVELFFFDKKENIASRVFVFTKLSNVTSKIEHFAFRKKGKWKDARSKIVFTSKIGRKKARAQKAKFAN